MSEISLRPTRSTDAGKIGAMISEAVALNDWKPLLHTGAEDIAHAGDLISRGWVTIAMDANAQVVGFLARDGEHVHSLYVSAAAQGSGVGAALLDHAKTQADRLDLWTFQANEGARRFYERHGFTEIETSDGSRNEEGLPDIRYGWPGAPSAPPQSATELDRSE